MLGNVYEWCHDGLRKYERGKRHGSGGADRAGRRSGAAGRQLEQLRAGRAVRAPARAPPRPPRRHIGFRPARVQQSPGQEQRSGSGAGWSARGPRRGAAAHAGPARRSGPRGRVSPRRASRSRRDRATWRRTRASVRRTGRGEMPPAAGPRIGHRHGLRKADLPANHPARSGPPPSAATASGCGSSSRCPRNKGKPVTQRMRWIGPGRFLMGSPTTNRGEPQKRRFASTGPTGRTKARSTW